jgi:hypothetical protein
MGLQGGGGGSLGELPAAKSGRYFYVGNTQSGYLTAIEWTHENAESKSHPITVSIALIRQISYMVLLLIKVTFEASKHET